MVMIGGPGRDRTDDLFHAISQLEFRQSPVPSSEQQLRGLRPMFQTCYSAPVACDNRQPPTLVVKWKVSSCLRCAEEVTEMNATLGKHTLCQLQSASLSYLGHDAD